MKLHFTSDLPLSKEHRSASLASLTQITALTVVFMALLASGFATAQQHESPACLAQADPFLLDATDAWRVVADADTGLALLLPLSHQLAPSGNIWYVYGMLDGEQLVPDVFIQRYRDLSAEEVAGQWFPGEVTLEPVHFGPATDGFRVMGPDQPSAEGYLVSAGADTYLIVRYEDFDWEGFYQVACSIHFIELVSDQNGW